MAAQALVAAQAFESIIGTIGNLFGGTDSVTGESSGTARSITEALAETTTDRRGTKKLNIDQVALQRIIEDVLGGAGGLAEIFAGEKRAGVFDSSVAAQASGNLAARLVGELAKLTAEEVTTDVGTDVQTQRQITDQVQRTSSKQESEDEGILKGIGDFFGF